VSIKKDSKVKIHYTLTVDGTVVDSSSGKDPLEYVHGSSQIIPGLEEQLVGLKKGDKKKVSVSPDKGYGPHNPQAVQKVPKTNFQEADKLKKGGVVSGEMGGQQFRAIIADISDKEVTLDLNHPLAGKTLHFDVEVVGILA
jgi:FKBP-type peptidyl-prolyl cis-trans isomerase SlyD